MSGNWVDDQLTKIEDALEALEEPTSREVYEAILPYDKKMIEGVVGAVALNGVPGPPGEAGMFSTSVDIDDSDSPYAAPAGYLVGVDASSANVAITLPTDPGRGAIVGVQLITDPGANTVTVTPTGGGAINGAGSFVLPSVQYAAVVFAYQEGVSDSWVVLTERNPSGGGSQPVITHAVNGLVKDLNLGDLSGTRSVILDPTAQDWQADHEYSNAGTGAGQNFPPSTVLPTTNPNEVKFLAFENGSGVSGSVEPTWSTDGSTPVDDGTVARPIVWQPFDLYNLWQATTALTGNVIGNGFAWSSDGGGNSGGSEPSWPASPNVDDTVSDGDITWTVVGPCAAWQQSHRYSFRLNSPTPTSEYMQFTVIPIGATPGVDYVFQGQPTGLFGTSGGTEPADWEDAMPSDGSLWIDGDIMWKETTDDESLVVTGIVAPDAASALAIYNGAEPGAGIKNIVLEDKAEVVSDYSAVAESAVGNRFNQDDSNITLNPVQFSSPIYFGAEWRPKVSAGA